MHGLHSRFAQGHGRGDGTGAAGYHPIVWRRRRRFFTKQPALVDFRSALPLAHDEPVLHLAIQRFEFGLGIADLRNQFCHFALGILDDLLVFRFGGRAVLIERSQLLVSSGLEIADDTSDLILLFFRFPRISWSHSKLSFSDRRRVACQLGLPIVDRILLLGRQSNAFIFPLLLALLLGHRLILARRRFVQLILLTGQMAGHLRLSFLSQVLIPLIDILLGLSFSMGFCELELFRAPTFLLSLQRQLGFGESQIGIGHGVLQPFDFAHGGELALEFRGSLGRTDFQRLHAFGVCAIGFIGLGHLVNRAQCRIPHPLDPRGRAAENLRQPTAGGRQSVEGFLQDAGVGDALANVAEDFPHGQFQRAELAGECLGLRFQLAAATGRQLLHGLFQLLRQGSAFRDRDAVAMQQLIVSLHGLGPDHGRLGEVAAHQARQVLDRLDINAHRLIIGSELGQAGEDAEPFMFGDAGSGRKFAGHGLQFLPVTVGELAALAQGRIEGSGGRLLAHILGEAMLSHAYGRARAA